MFHDHRQFEAPMLAAFADEVPDAVRAMLDALLESAALARPGIDADAYAGELRLLAGDAARLARALA